MHNMTPSQEIVEQASETSGILGAEVPDVIYHYTSIDALNGIIIGNPNPDAISFFFTHFQHFNDETEVLYGLSAINQVICKQLGELHKVYNSNGGEPYKDVASFDLLEKMLYHLMVRYTDDETAIGFKNDYLKKYSDKKAGGCRQIKEAHENHRSSVFIGSFSRLNDNERMWCDYAGGGTGVCLALDTKKILSTFPFKALQLVTSVKYMEKPLLDEAIDTFFKKTIDAIVKHKVTIGNLDALIATKPDVANDLFSLIALRLVEFISTTKSPSWCHEDEVRIFFPHLTTKRVKDIKYRVSRDGRLIPYISLSFPKEIIRDIIPGRKCTDQQKRAIEMMKKTKGL